MNKKIRQYEQIKSHGENLLHLFPNATEKDPIALYKKLRRLETAAHAIALRLCNGPEYAEGEADQACASILAKVNTILGNPGSVGIRLGGKPNVPVFINRDPRGYALKIAESYMVERREQWDRQIAKQGKKACLPSYWAFLRLHRDFEGYGIIAPEITGY